MKKLSPASLPPRTAHLLGSILLLAVLLTAVLLPLFLFPSDPVFAAENPWFGTWKLNRDKSQFTGETQTLTKIPVGYHLDMGAVAFDIYEDGQDHVTFPNHTASLKSTGPNQWLRIVKTNGKETSRSIITLSEDGNTLSFKSTGTRADGSTYTSEMVDQRVGTGSGLAGTWKNTKESSNAVETVILSDAGNGKVKWDFPSSKGGYVSTPDGAPVPMTGPRATPGETVATTIVSPTELNYTEFMSGKPFVQGTDTLSPDGKVMTEVNWLVSQPTEKTTAVYEKQ